MTINQGFNSVYFQRKINDNFKNLPMKDPNELKMNNAMSTTNAILAPSFELRFLGWASSVQSNKEPHF